MSEATAQFPEALKPLFRPARYKVLYGGRGAGKSHGVATYLLSQAAAVPLRVLCCREFQSSIRESVHRLLGDMIERHRLADRFEVLEKGIRGTNGSEFIFEGLRHNVGRIRSLEGIDRVWVEEAQTVSAASWEVLIPTIRKEGSEIIITLNPQLETDATYERFVLHPPPEAVLIKVNYHDNPWLPTVLKAEMEHLKLRDPDAYQHVWLGECRHTLDGAIYARELREASEEGRITGIVPDPTRPVDIYIDLGWADSTAIWFVQHVQNEVRLIDYEEDSQRAFSEYLQLLHRRKYTYRTMWLPHDAQAKSLGTGRSIEEIARGAGWRVRIVPRLSIADGINATRTLFPTMWFDRTRCIDGIQSLRRYRYDVDPITGQYSRQPLHDGASHGADALRYVAVAMTDRERAQYARRSKKQHYPRRNVNWLRI